MDAQTVWPASLVVQPIGLERPTASTPKPSCWWQACKTHTYTPCKRHTHTMNTHRHPHIHTHSYFALSTFPDVMERQAVLWMPPTLCSLIPVMEPTNTWMWPTPAFPQVSIVCVYVCVCKPLTLTSICTITVSEKTVICEGQRTTLNCGMLLHCYMVTLLLCYTVILLYTVTVSLLLLHCYTATVLYCYTDILLQLYCCRAILL